MNEMTGFSPDTISGDYYYDPEIFEKEKERIFYRTWQYVGHVSMLPEPSTYIVRDIADESVVILKDKDGNLGAFYNVCQHRAHRLLEGEGKLRRLITCPYHSWAYNLDGSLQNAPGTDEIDDFDVSTICLKKVRWETFCGFIFVNLDDDAVPLAELTKGLEEEVRSFSPSPETLMVSNRYQIDLAANWKNSIENFSECYHCPGKHPSLSQSALDMETYRIECNDNFYVHRSRDKGEEVGYEINSEGASRPNEFRSILIWPNTVIEVYPGGNLTIFHHIPVGPEKTIHGLEWYFSSSQPTEEEQAVVDFVHEVRLEDVPLCESVQKGLHSRGYGKGRLVIDAGRTYVSGHSVHEFQKKVISALAD